MQGKPQHQETKKKAHKTGKILKKKKKNSIKGLINNCEINSNISTAKVYIPIQYPKYLQEDIKNLFMNS